MIIILVSPLCHSAVATDVHHDKSEAEIGNTANECQHYRLSTHVNVFMFPRLSPLHAYTAELDSKRKKKNETQKGELHMNFTILS